MGLAPPAGEKVFFLLNCVEVGIVSGKYVMCNLLGVVLKKKKNNHVVSIAQVEFWGTHCAGAF